ncbi:family 2A encapsulin nanocompartment cargo protein cysteine desulfurase [Olivibacter sitiensis]|uniref:family 2A encapsulin nanocompartment cargo protein cysteine desulfurase n=1 Tax=Olivibacter sitiensis TaxID=376470 RepID=UPI0003FD6917|nr:family 2A encapsulin nanocompartment cargo protein cysteine desulfurase [Olivibacter sitiensis]
MSDNNFNKHNYELPEESELERLANSLFQTSPGGIDPASPPGTSDRVHPYIGGYHAPVSLHDNGGISPSAIHQGNAIDLYDPQTSLPDPNAKGYGEVPHSTAGSGGASAGDAVSGSRVEDHDLGINALPFEGGKSSFEQQLLDALRHIQLSGPSAQFSNPPSSVLDESAYYFTPISPFASGSETQWSSYGASPTFNVNLVRNDFPILNERVNGRPLIWFDNAATTQKPQSVLDRLAYFYQHENSNIHRAAHTLAARATDAYEEARIKVQHFLNARSINEVVFVRGTTEAINLVASSWGEQYLHEGDEIILSHLEHHANIVPWQLLAKKKNLNIKVIPVDDDGQVLIDEYAKLISPRTKLVSFTLVSNALGTITPAKQIVDIAHAAGAKVLADGAQSVSHIRTDVQQLGADWFVFSGHKIFGPTGIGVLYGKEGLLNATQPYQGGGNMIKDVTFEHTEFHEAPSRFEAGTGNIADAVALGAAIDYVNKLGIDNIYQYEHFLLHYATSKLKAIPGIRLIGTAKEKTSVLSFVLNGYTTTQVGEALSKEGIAVRAGHHCAQPILRRYGLESTVRPSFAFYNTCAEIDQFIDVIKSLKH